MKKRIEIGGSAANPPHLGNVRFIDSLLKSKLFDKIIWVVTGNRKDKSEQVSPDHRVAMTEMTLGRFRANTETDFVIRYSDVYSENTPTLILLQKLQEEFSECELTYFFGSDLINEIRTSWYDGERLWEEQNFLVIPREDYPVPELSKNFKVYHKEFPNISSTKIREVIRKGGHFIPFVTFEVADYIYRHRLYRLK